MRLGTRTDHARHLRRSQGRSALSSPAAKLSASARKGALCVFALAYLLASLMSISASEWEAGDLQQQRHSFLSALVPLLSGCHSNRCQASYLAQYALSLSQTHMRGIGLSLYQKVMCFCIVETYACLPACLHNNAESVCFVTLTVGSQMCHAKRR